MKKVSLCVLIAAVLIATTVAVSADPETQLVPAGSVTSSLFVPWTVSVDTVWNWNGTPRIPPGDRLSFEVRSWQDADIHPGTLGAIAYPGDIGPNGYRDRLRGTTPGALTVSMLDWLDTLRGSALGITYQALRDRLHEDTLTYDQWLSTYDPESKRFADTTRIVLLPIVAPGDPAEGYPQVRVTGFAPFFIDDFSYYYDGLISTAVVSGRFMRATSEGGTLYWDPSGELYSDTNTLVMTPVPEPSSLLTLLAGTGGIGCVLRSRRRERWKETGTQPFWHASGMLRERRRREMNNFHAS